MNLQEINKKTPEMVESGVRLFQIHRFGKDDTDHVKMVGSWANIPLYARVIDMGCGIGEFSTLLSKYRPDIKFTLVNISDVQLSYAPDAFKKICCDFRNVPEESETYDVVLFLFAIGHEDHLEGLAEAKRLLKPGGILFVYDMHRLAENEHMQEVEYKVLPRAEFESLARQAGFKQDFFLEPLDDGSYGTQILGDDFERIFGGTRPAIWRFVKCGPLG